MCLAILFFFVFFFLGGFHGSCNLGFLGFFGFMGLAILVFFVFFGFMGVLQSWYVGFIARFPCGKL